MVAGQETPAPTDHRMRLYALHVPRLVVAYPSGLPFASSDAVVVDEKLRTGMEMFAHLWDGDVTLATPAPSVPSSTGVGDQVVNVNDLGFEVTSASSWRDAVASSRPDLLLAPLIPKAAELSRWVDRTVFVVERTPEDLLAWDLRTSSSSVSSTRIRLGSRRLSRRYERVVRSSRGIQCNGLPAYERFGHLSPSSMLFYDTRITPIHVQLAKAAERVKPADAPHLCFSGRLVPEKGPASAVAVLNRLRDQGIDARLTVLGRGPLEEALRRGAGDRVAVHHPLSFATEWTQFIREKIDLMVLPHLIGDPSGTYLEAAACGVPVVGFDNPALAALEARHGLAVTAPVGDARSLAAVAKSLLSDAPRWLGVRGRGLEFMAGHHFEAEMARRVSHLRSLVA